MPIRVEFTVNQTKTVGHLRYFTETISDVITFMFLQRDALLSVVLPDQSVLQLQRQRLTRIEV